MCDVSCAPVDVFAGFQHILLLARTQPVEHFQRRSLSLSLRVLRARLRSGSLLHTSRSHFVSLYRSHTLLLSPTIIGLVSVAPRNARHMFNAQLFWSCCAFSTVHSSARVSHCIRQFFWLLLLRCCFAFVLKAKWSKSRCRLKLATCNK